MQRDATVPIGVWLPALIASIVVAVCWSNSSRAPRLTEPAAADATDGRTEPGTERPRNPHIVTEGAALAVVESPDVAPTEIPSSPAPATLPSFDPEAPASPADDASDAEPVTAASMEPHESPPSRASDAAPEVRDEPESTTQRARLANFDFPPSWPPLDAEFADDFGDAPIAASARRAVDAARARLGRAAATCRTSSAALAPFVVFVASDETGARQARRIARFHARFTEQVLEPARLMEPLAIALPIDLTERDEAGARTSEPDDESMLRDLGEQLLAALFDARGRARPPRWWCDGAIEVARHEELTKALSAAPASASLVALFDERMGERAGEAAHAAAGSFAAYCLGAAGRDDHRRATWLEFAAPLAASGRASERKSGDAWRAELAARFGCATLSELEQAWHKARGD